MKMKKYIFILSVLVSFILTSCDIVVPPDNIIESVNALGKPMRYRITDGAIIRFALDSLPEIIGESAIAGMLDTFIVYYENGKPEVMFSAIVYNSSYTVTFHVDTFDVNGDVPNIFRAELLTMGNKVVDVADKTSFCVCESRPIDYGYPQSEEPRTLAPRWADEYPYNTRGQCFDLDGLKYGKYQVRYTFDPDNLYGQFQVVIFTVIWDGTNFYAVK